MRETFYFLTGFVLSVPSITIFVDLLYEMTPEISYFVSSAKVKSVLIAVTIVIIYIVHKRLKNNSK